MGWAESIIQKNERIVRNTPKQPICKRFFQPFGRFFHEISYFSSKFAPYLNKARQIQDNN